MYLVKKNGQPLSSGEGQIISLLLEAGYSLRSCVGCDNFNAEKEVCQLHNNLRPPARVIAEGCDDFDYLPF
jgi:hypothetical protein